MSWENKSYYRSVRMDRQTLTKAIAEAGRHSGVFSVRSSVDFEGNVFIMDNALYETGTMTEGEVVAFLGENIYDAGRNFLWMGMIDAVIVPDRLYHFSLLNLDMVFGPLPDIVGG